MSGESRASSLQKIALDILKRITETQDRTVVLGLGSGTTIASILPTLAEGVKKRGLEVQFVPTSLQIQLVAEGLGLRVLASSPSVDFVVDGADQIDSALNLIKGGGGALFKEKIVMASCKKESFIVADERKFAERLCSGGARVPVEVNPFAWEFVRGELKETSHGEPTLRLADRGFPYYTENGNIIFDTLFEPILRPETLEKELKLIAGVVEAGIFTFEPLRVYTR